MPGPLDPFQNAQNQLLQAQNQAIQQGLANQGAADAALAAQPSANILKAWQDAAMQNVSRARLAMLKVMYQAALRREALSAPLPTDSKSLLMLMQDAQLKGDTEMANKIKKSLDVAKAKEDAIALDASKDLASRPLPTDTVSLQKLLQQAQDQGRGADMTRIRAALGDAMARDAAATAIGVSPMPATTNAGADPIWQRVATVAVMLSPLALAAYLGRR